MDNELVGCKLFSWFFSVGATVSPCATLEGVEPLFNADVVLGRPVVRGLSPASGSLAGGQTVTANGSHPTGVSTVEFGGLAARTFSPVSNTKVLAVAPASAAGTVDVTVTTLGGTSAFSASDRFTFRAPAAGGGGGAGSGPAPEPASFAVPPGGKVTLKIKLSKNNFRILKRNHKIRVRVTVTLENLAGTTSRRARRSP